MNGQETNFPPYDIAASTTIAYRITLAVAGFSPEEITITAQQNLLAVAGRRRSWRHQYLHRGIAAQSFDKQFNLADHVEVTGASFENGLLQIELVRKIPEAMKPRRIQINGAAKSKDVDGGKAA